MATGTVDLGEWKDFQRDLEQFAQRDQQRILYRAGEVVGVTFDDYVKDRMPPEVRRKSVSKYWTAKQLRWWWATMHAKAQGRSRALPGWKAIYKIIKGRKTLVISGSYKRTNTLVRTLTYSVEQTPDTTSVRYGTNVRYAKWVIDLRHQSKYHKDNWDTLQMLAEQAAPLVQRIFADEIERLTRQALGG